MTQQRTRPDYLNIDFNVKPVTVAWEITRACALACRHCRAEAQPKRDPRELTSAEALGVVDQIAELGPMILVVTGGDPLMRPDVFDITADREPIFTFGGGPHYCLGASLARAEMQVALPLLARRLPDLALAGEVQWRPRMGQQRHLHPGL